LSALPGSPGEFNWGGYAGTFFWVDPKERLIGVLMMQAPTARLRTRALLKQLVLQAIEKPAP
jgi:CubicO group peptidase (beta-lactamase class C family)